MAKKQFPTPFKVGDVVVDTIVGDYGRVIAVNNVPSQWLTNNRIMKHVRDFGIITIDGTATMTTLARGFRKATDEEVEMFELQEVIDG